jgi:hypothetical protein
MSTTIFAIVPFSKNSCAVHDSLLDEALASVY